MFSFGMLQDLIIRVQIQSSKLNIFVPHVYIVSNHTDFKSYIYILQINQMLFSCNYPINKKSQYINKFISLTASDLDTNKPNFFELTCFNTNFTIQIKVFIYRFSKKKGERFLRQSFAPLFKF